MVDWKAGERELLRYLALNGPADQRKVSKAYGIAPPTLNLAKENLMEKGYIRLKGKEKAGRGAPRKIYALTPAGLVAAVLEGDLWDRVDDALRYWTDIAPIFIKRYEALSEWHYERELQDLCRSALVKNKIMIELLGKSADQLTCYMSSKGMVSFTTEKETHGYRRMDPWMGLIEILNWNFYTEVTKSFGVSESGRSINMVKSDRGLREGWLRWFEGEEERFNRLREHRRILLNNRLREG